MRVLRGVGRCFTGTGAGVIEHAAVAVGDDGRIAWVGPDGARPPAAPRGRPVLEEDCDGALLTAGLIDAHTHPVYAGARLAEIARRTAGASYAELAAAGGGIAATVAATRAEAPATLATLVAARLGRWLREGTTTVEAKTGYHLERQGELWALDCLRALDGAPGLPRVVATYLGAHGVPADWPGGRSAYVQAVADWAPAAAAAGARACDVFCDAGAFTVAESRRILRAGRAAGLRLRIHADELERTGGAELAAELGADSADHLLRVTAEDAHRLAAAGVVATLAPVTALAMHQRPPARLLQAAGVTLALATDHNPGTSGITSMSLVVGLAVLDLGLSVTEALRAATAGGAQSLRLPDRGTVAPGQLGDLVLWDADHEGAFAWALGLRPRRVWRGGEPVVPSPSPPDPRPGPV